MKRFFAWPMAIIFMGLSVLLFADAKPAFAGDKLKMGGDMRVRIEQDNDSNKDDDRQRNRIRLRLKGKYKANDTVSVGFRLSTGTGSTQSPHQTLGLGSGSGSNGDFGIDRAFIKLSFGGVKILGGKFGMPMWNPAEFIWDGDIQPEGFAVGFGTKAGSMKLNISAGYFTINEAGWGDDDYFSTVQASISGGGDWQFKAAVGVLTVEDSNEASSGWSTGDGADNGGRVPGGSMSITHVLAEVKGKALSFKPRFGFGYADSNAEDYWGQTVDAGTGATSGSGLDSDDTSALLVYVRGNVGGVDLRAYYWDTGYAAQPGLGMLGQDNFPFSGNFTGYHLQVGKKLFDAVSADFRVYYQETKNEDIKVYDSNVNMQGVRDRTRYQLNLNVKF